jgi:tRNA(adenine34) deaminase
MFTERDKHWMQYAIQLAETAAKKGEVPVGAVLILDDKIIGEGHNRPITDTDPSAHAEMIALREGAKTIKNYRLLNSTLYVTLEPCIMCIGALVHARVKRVVFGAHDPKAGAVESVFEIGNTDKLNHRIDYQGGMLGEQCGTLLSEFFKARRMKNTELS